MKQRSAANHQPFTRGTRATRALRPRVSGWWVAGAALALALGGVGGPVARAEEPRAPAMPLLRGGGPVVQHPELLGMPHAILMMQKELERMNEMLLNAPAPGETEPGTDEDQGPTPSDQAPEEDGERQQHRAPIVGGDEEGETGDEAGGGEEDDDLQDEMEDFLEDRNEEVAARARESAEEFSRRMAWLLNMNQQQNMLDRLFKLFEEMEKWRKDRERIEKLARLLEILKDISEGRSTVYALSGSIADLVGGDGGEGEGDSGGGEGGGGGGGS